MNPQTELEKRYPQADFSIYFRHLEACRTVKGLNTHDHHICPRKPFPEYEHMPENKVILTIEDHAQAHELLHAAEPELWAQSKWIAAASKGGKIGGQKNVESGHLARVSAKVRTAEHQRNAAHFAGLAGQKTHRQNNTSRYSSTYQKAANLIANHKRWHIARNQKSSACSLCTGVSNG